MPSLPGADGAAIILRANVRSGSTRKYIRVVPLWLSCGGSFVRGLAGLVGALAGVDRGDHHDSFSGFRTASIRIPKAVHAGPGDDTRPVAESMLFIAENCGSACF